MERTEIIRNTFSVCPVCLKKIPAYLTRRSGEKEIWMRKSCPEHGGFRVKIWSGRTAFEHWTQREEPLAPEQAEGCAGDCRNCADGVHGQDTCCVILEVTKACNMHCSFCFAHGGETEEQPPYEELCRAIDEIARKGNGPLIQFAGGEPTLRDDLPELVRYAKEAGCQYTQVNTNGIRLAEDEAFVRKLAEAGLDIVFLQFDGTDEAVYRMLRGREMLEIKRKAIRSCGRYRVGVTLVPAIVRGVNDSELGNIVREAVDSFPAVKAVHFQPVTYLGRVPYPAEALPEHYTLDELMADLCAQTGIPESALLPSRCDHAMCEFHATFMLNGKRQLVPMTDRAADTRQERTDAARNRQYVAEHWRREQRLTAENASERAEAPLPERDPGLPLVCTDREEMDFDIFVRKMRSQTLKISAMAFQDAMNLDLERLYRCSLHVYEDGRLLPFCAKYMTPAAELPPAQK